MANITPITPESDSKTWPEGARPCGAKDSFELAGRSQGWHVVSGMVDVFLLDRISLAAGHRYHIVRIKAGGLMFGAVDAAGATLTLLAVPGNNSVIAPFNLGDQAPLQYDAMILALEQWIGTLADSMAPPGSPPVDSHLFSESQTIIAEKNKILLAKDSPLWLSSLPAHAEFIDLGPVGDRAFQRLPLSSKTWLTLPVGEQVEAQSVADWFNAGLIAEDFAAFHDLTLTVTGDRYRIKRKNELAELDVRQERRNQALKGTIKSLVKTIEDRKFTETHSIDPLFAACELVAGHMNISLAMPSGGSDAINSSRQPVELIARSSRIQCRDVALGHGWWRRESGPLLGRWQDGQPCALLPFLGGGYRVVDPTRGTDTKVTEDIAAGIAPVASQFCEPLPDGPIGLVDMIRFCIKGTGIDTLVIIIMILLAGTLSLVPPLAVREVFNTVIPTNEVSQLLVIGIGLVISASAVALFNLVQGTGLLRIESRLDLRLQVALWDRVVRAPASFFRAYSSGDLINRMESVNTIRKLLTGSVIQSFISGAMGLFSFCLMLYYAPLLSVALALLTLLVTFCGFLLGWRMIAMDRQALILNGRIQSLVVQLLGALTKLRVAAAEDIAFRRWAQLFRNAQRYTNKNGHAYVAMMSMMGGLGALSLAVLFSVVGIQSGELLAFFYIPVTWQEIAGRPMSVVMPLGDFIAFISAYVQFMLAATALMMVCIRLSSVPPLLGRLKPIFQTPTEHYRAQDPVGEITGRIEFKNVTFRYNEAGPPILDNLSLSIEPGEFVALVGPSGSGKSTVIRLLLGFETQESGSIYLDDKDLLQLDKTQVRGQLGVVVQEGKLIPGTILENMTGGADVTREDVWEAARQAGFDEDLRNMPQGLDTPINDGATNISGGQRQRLLVTRALIRKPRLLILDEATSALDNKTQEIVSQTIQNMAITRIAVAHRLSTIVKADRIFVIAAGSVVESGTYQELMEMNRIFADLVRRQIE